MISPIELQGILDSPEGSRIEFKSAAGGFYYETAPASMPEEK
jgi:hypothetical protein